MKPVPDSSYVFKVAETDSEFDQIFRLNYLTFVEEIPQHEPNSSGRLIDKFHPENNYLICLKKGVLQGMMALRDQRPFSLDGKLENLDQYLPKNRKIVEIRLLAVVPGGRSGQILKGLLAFLTEFNRSKHWNLAVISGTTRQEKLYHHMGYVPFGPLVGKEGAYYQPMYVELEAFESSTRKIINHQPTIYHFLPGPVNLSRAVREAFTQAPISHRSIEFRDILETCESRLCALTGARQTVIALGSGSLGNDMVAAQLSLLHQKGVILTNGEFGERLIDHASRFGLKFDVIKKPWGEPISLDELAARLEPSHQWLWMVACETSTGMKNDLAGICALGQRSGIKICVDAVSAIGAYPLSLDSIYLASGSSGKALGAYPGLAMVFHNHEIKSSRELPRYLDLGYYYEQEKIPFTQSSNLIAALSTALLSFKNAGERFQHSFALAARLREILKNNGIPILVDADSASPAVFTIPLPPGINGLEMTTALKELGIHLAGESVYLRTRNWIQICLMGEVSADSFNSIIQNMSITKPSLLKLKSEGCLNGPEQDRNHEKPPS